MVQPGETTSRVLETLPPRPPTPPRETNHNYQKLTTLTRFLGKGLGSETPPNVSPKSAEFANTPADKTTKKVGWSNSTEYKDPPEVQARNSPQSVLAVKPLPPSDRKPTKSILKPYNGVNALNRAPGLNRFAPPHTYQTFAIMLESIVQQLAGEDRNSKLDAYMTLSGVLKATDTIPDAKALKDKMGLITQFIQRDMTARTVTGTYDTALVNNSLLLLASLLYKNEHMHTDFCSFVVDHAINAFEDTSVSKDVVKNVMFILSQQNFPAKVMTAERAARIIQALHSIEKHVKGKSIVLLRLEIYRKLLKQCKPSMIGNIVWLQDLFCDMLTGFKDIRALVISFGLEAAFQLGTESKVSRGVMEIFSLSQGHERYADYFAARLNAMIDGKEDLASVPQIWSTIILFLRSKPKQLQHWEFMKKWLQIMQRCFNSNDHEVKVQANYAWNRLVFAINLDENTSSAMIKTLSQPFVGQLRRKATGKHAKEARQVTIGSICNLLYYAFQPGASAAQLNLFWDSFVDLLLGKIMSQEQRGKSEINLQDNDHVIAILSSMLAPSIIPGRPLWRSDRIVSNDLIKADEIPALDVKWIRQNANRVMNVLENVLEAQNLKEVSKRDAPFWSLWRGFLSSVAAAGAKEVKTSNDTMGCLARILTMITRLVRNGPFKNVQSIEPWESASDYFLDVVEILVTTTIDGLGVRPFTEKLLSISQQNTFAVVATPSTSSSKILGNSKSALSHLICIFLQPSRHLEVGMHFETVLYRVVAPFIQTRASKWIQIELVKDLTLQLSVSPSNVDATVRVWSSLAQSVVNILNDKDNASSSNASSNNSQPLGSQFKNIVKVLEIGIGLFPEKPEPQFIDVWRILYNRASSYITNEAGDSGRALSLIEPIAKALENLAKSGTKPSIEYCNMILSSAQYPKDIQTLDAAQRKLWGTASGQKTSSDPYKYLYASLGVALEMAYNQFTEHSDVTVKSLMTEVLRLFHQCPQDNKLRMLLALQNGTAPWIADQGGKLIRETRGDHGISLERSCAAPIWSKVCEIIEGSPSIDTALLNELGVIITAGLGSTHKSIVQKAIIFWNSTFGKRATLEYPPALKDVLSRLRPIADLELPSFSESNEPASCAPIFIDSDSEDSTPFHFEPSPAPRSRHLTPSVASSPLPSTRNQKSPRRVLDLLALPSSSTGITTKKRPLDLSAPTSHKRKQAKKDLTPKLRHDDSQIEFAAIESSPVVDNGESQVLTDRQREVRERQQAEVTMFPDLRSSPKGKKTSRSKLELTSNRPVSEDEENHPATPSLLPKEAMSDDFITSSPTPRRTGNNAVVDENGELNMDMSIESDAADLPSSPPKRTITSRDHTLEASLPLPASRAEDAAKDIWDDIPSLPTGHHISYNRLSSIGRRDGPQDSKLIPEPPKDSQVPSQQSEPELPRKKGPVGRTKIGESLAAETEARAIAQLPDGTDDVFVDAPNPIMESEAQSSVLKTMDKPVMSALSLPQPDVPESLDDNMLTGSSQNGRTMKPAKSNGTGKRQGLRSRASQVSLDECADYSEGDESSILRLMEGFDGTPVGTLKSKLTFGDVSSTRSISLRSANKFDKEEYEVVPGSSPVKPASEEQGKTEAEEIVSKKPRKRKAKELDGDDSTASTPIASLVPESAARRTRSHSNSPSISVTSTPVSRGRRFTRTNSKLGQTEDIIGDISETPTTTSARRTRSSLNAIEKASENVGAGSGKDTAETEGSSKDAEGNQTEIADSQPTGKEKEAGASSFSKSASAKSKDKGTTLKATSREEKQASQAKDTAKGRRASSRLRKAETKQASPEIPDQPQVGEHSSEAKPRKKRKVQTSEAGSVSSLSELDNAEFEEYETAPEPTAEILDIQEIQNNAQSSNALGRGSRAARGRGSRGRGRGKGRAGKANNGETGELAERARASSPSVDLDAPFNPTTVLTAPETKNPATSVSLKKEEKSDMDMDEDSEDEDKSLSDVSNINDPQVQEDIRKGRLDVHGYWPEPGSRIYVPGTTETTIVRDQFHQDRMMPWGDSDSEDYDSSGIEDWEMLFNSDQALESVEKVDDEFEDADLPEQSEPVDGIEEETVAEEEPKNLADNEELPLAEEPEPSSKVDFDDEIANDSELDAEAEAQIMEGLSQMSHCQQAELSRASTPIDLAISSSENLQPNASSGSRPVPAVRVENMQDTAAPAPAEVTAHSPLSALESLLQMVKNASLSREDAAKMENLMWDLKGEVYLAERRSRR